MQMQFIRKWKKFFQRLPFCAKLNLFLMIQWKSFFLSFSAQGGKFCETNLCQEIAFHSSNNILSHRTARKKWRRKVFSNQQVLRWRHSDWISTNLGKYYLYKIRFLFFSLFSVDIHRKRLFPPSSQWIFHSSFEKKKIPTGNQYMIQIQIDTRLRHFPAVIAEIPQHHNRSVFLPERIEISEVEELKINMRKSHGILIATWESLLDAPKPELCRDTPSPRSQTKHQIDTSRRILFGILAWPGSAGELIIGFLMVGKTLHTLILLSAENVIS